MRCVVTAFFSFLENIDFPFYKIGVSFLYIVLVELCFSLDFVLYLLQARRFYRHLKGRETEARLFKDKTSYHNERALRLHFKVASILIAIAISLFIIVMYFQSFNILLLLKPYIIKRDFEILLNKIMPIFQCISCLFYILYKIVMFLNYLYFVTMLLVIYLRRKWRLNRVNRKIKPIVAKYHETLYYRC